MFYQREPPKKTKNYMGGATAMQNLTLGDDAFLMTHLLLSY
jgi:hypothetical protein